MSDKLISGVLWMIVITGVLVVIGGYWILTVLIPAIFMGIAFVIKLRNQSKTKRTLEIRPEHELNANPEKKALQSISGSNIRIVRTEKYKENWKRIADELEVETSGTFPIEGSLRVYREDGHSDSSSGTNSELVVLAFVDYLVVGEVARVQLGEVLPDLLGLRGAGLCVLNTKLGPKGAIHSITAYPVPNSEPWWKL